jgi:hypothetical protein
MRQNNLATSTIGFLEKTGDVRKRIRDRNAYYHQDDLKFFQKFVQSDNLVFLIGTNVVEMATQLKCKKAIVLELDPVQTIPALPPSVHLVTSLREAFNFGPFDYVLLPYSLQVMDDIQEFLEELYRGLSAHTRVMAVHFNFLWAPLFRLAQRWGLKAPMPDMNWLNRQDIRTLLRLTGYEELTSGTRCLIPIRIPWFSDFCNDYLAPLPFFKWCCQKTYVAARPLMEMESQKRPISVSVVVPARNEAGNISALLSRMPVFGSSLEIIFVEGHSKDATWEEIQTQIKSHPRSKLFILQACQQLGEGKADAVRLGFSRATGDLLMILDADLSVQPEDLIHFFSAYQRGSAEFLNGSRLVYQMERHAMQILNLFFNKAFAALLSWLIGQRIKDTLCGTKVLTRQNYLRIQTHLHNLGRLDPFGDFELLFGASRLNLRISDVPVRYKERAYGQTNIRRFKHGWQLLTMVWACWKELK